MAQFGGGLHFRCRYWLGWIRIPPARSQTERCREIETGYAAGEHNGEARAKPLLPPAKRLRPTAVSMASLSPQIAALRNRHPIKPITITAPPIEPPMKPWLGLLVTLSWSRHPFKRATQRFRSRNRSRKARLKCQMTNFWPRQPAGCKAGTFRAQERPIRQLPGTEI